VSRAKRKKGEHKKKREKKKMAGPPILQGHHALEFIRRIGMTLEEFERMTAGVDRGLRQWRAPLSEQEERFMNDANITANNLIASYEKLAQIMNGEGTYLTSQTVPSNRWPDVERHIQREADWFSRFSQFFTKKPYLFDFVDPGLTAEHVELLKKFFGKKESELLERIIRNPRVDPLELLLTDLLKYKGARRTAQEAARDSNEEYFAKKAADAAKASIAQLLDLELLDYNPNSGDEGDHSLPDAGGGRF
jgi:hypothetical protein